MVPFAAIRTRGELGGLAQLQQINRRQIRGSLVQIRPAASFEDLSLFAAKDWFHQRNHSEPARFERLR